MDTKIVVSVLMPVFNGEKYLAEAIESILNQTYSDFEFIIINDGSTDSTAEILERYRQRDRRIKIYNQSNQGLVASLNRGINLAQGVYIARMDADDISLPVRLQLQVDYLKKYPDIGLAGTGCFIIDAQGKSLDTVSVTFEPHTLKTLINETNQFTHGSVVFRKSCTDQVGPYRESFRYAQDYDLWLRIADRFGLGNIPEPLYKWRLTFDSISVKKITEQKNYAIFAQELAIERKRCGSDRLQREPKAWEAIHEFIEKKSTPPGVPEQLNHLIYLIGKSGDRRLTFRLLRLSMSKNPFVFKTWKLLLKNLIKYPGTNCDNHF